MDHSLSQIAEMDRASVLHPFTQAKDYASGKAGDPTIVTGGTLYPLRGTETVSGIVDDIQEQAATQLRGQVQIVWTDAPDPWIVIAVFLALGAVVLLWRVRL